MNNLDVAVRLAQAGLFVIPCDPARKAPRLLSWQTRATKYQNGVRYYWDKYGEDSMPGIALGLCGLIAVDIDVKNDIDGCAAFSLLLDAYGEFPRCPVTLTPSGGYHLICRQPSNREPLGNGTGALPKGIDIRGCGGQVIAPGAVRSDGTFYESVPGWPELAEASAAGTIPEIPAWLVAIIETEPVGRGPSVDGGPRAVATGDKSAWVAAALAAEARALAALGEGGRNNALNSFVFTFAGHAANGWIDHEEIQAAAEWACQQNGYLGSRDVSDGPKQFQKTFDSAWRSGFGKPTSGPRERISATGPLIKLKLTA